MGLRRRCQLFSSLWTILEQVCNSQLGGDVEHLRGPVTGHHPHDLLQRLRQVHARSSRSQSLTCSYMNEAILSLRPKMPTSCPTSSAQPAGRNTVGWKSPSGSSPSRTDYKPILPKLLCNG